MEHRLSTVSWLGPIMVGVREIKLTSDERRFLRHPWIGGVVLFARNYSDPDQLRALVQAIGAIRAPPLIVAVDQEGGRVQRFREGFSAVPAAGRIGAAYSQDVARGLAIAHAVGDALGEELAWAGIDLNFAPVVDLDAGNHSVIGARAFHADPEAVVDLAQAYLTGMRRWGVHGVVKHFPGHGSALGDTHTGAVEDARDRESIARTDLQVYRMLVERGIEAVMSNHVAYPAVAPGPASFSQHWLRQVLRAELGFQGVVFSDDLSMGAANPADPLSLRVRGVLDGGCGVALVCNELDEVPAMLNGFADVPPRPGLEGFARELTPTPPRRPGRHDAALAEGFGGTS